MPLSHQSFTASRVDVCVPRSELFEALLVVRIMRIRCGHSNTAARGEARWQAYWPGDEETGRRLAEEPGPRNASESCGRH